MKRKGITLSLCMSIAAFLAILLQTSVYAQETGATDKTVVLLRAYGPGGPAPAMREAAEIFEEKKGIRVEINAGPPSTWKDQAMQSADLIFSGSERQRNQVSTLYRNDVRC